MRSCSATATVRKSEQRSGPARGLYALLCLSSLVPCMAQRCHLKGVRQEDGSFRLGSCEELYLTSAGIGDAGAKALAAALKNNKSLRLLDLWKNGIGPEGAAALADALSSNTKLDKLYLNENPIGSMGAASLAKALWSNRVLTTLWLSRTGLGDDGARALANMLGGSGEPGNKGNVNLQVLDLWECGISAAGAEAIALSLQRNRGLRTLELRGNRIGDAGAAAFAAMMPHNGPLSTLDLLANNIGATGRAALMQVRKACTLHTLAESRSRSCVPAPGAWILLIS